jgi:peptidyl-prolyl cis-trans isomerase B (cyclophilin B)
MIKWSILILAITWISCNPRVAEGLRKKDRQKDVLLVTTLGDLVIRLSDSTPLHRDNFLRLVKKGYYDSLLFHRVIRRFVIQAGDPDSRRAKSGEELGSGGPGYTIPAEFRSSLFHRKGAVAAARESDAVNPAKASSGSQFYIVEGHVYSAAALDSVQRLRLQGKPIPADHRAIYMTLGGAPHLDLQYTVFGEVIRGLDRVDSIASVPTDQNDRPQSDLRILRAKLIQRSRQ